MSSNEGHLTIIQHLDELRQRLIKVALALAVTTALSLIFVQPLFSLLLRPISGLTTGSTQVTTRLFLAETKVLTTTIVLPAENPLGSSTAVSATILLPQGTELPVSFLSPQEAVKPVFLRPTEMFITYFKLALVMGVGLAMPLIVWQVMLFLRGPSYSGLSRREMRSLYALVPLAGVFFAVGVAFAYFLLLPFALKYLFGLGGDLARPMPAVGDYFSFVTTLLLWVGLSFETPLLIFFLAKVRVVNTKKLTSWRKYAILAAFVIAAVITPTPDPFNQIMVAIPLIILYEIGIWMSKLA
ncbi:MAG: twin-arginine translocase subunit TatC [Chloroflexi bacterium]|nr:twin-arginine translocase subunit TatC [Chloroflexota bacterium]